jgi:hypothetical protein
LLMLGANPGGRTAAWHRARLSGRWRRCAREGPPWSSIRRTHRGTRRRARGDPTPGTDAHFAGDDSRRVRGSLVALGRLEPHVSGVAGVHALARRRYPGRARPARARAR